MKKYQPINCNFYDFLIELSTFKVQSTILHEESGINPAISKGLILDIFTKDGAEFIKMSTNKIIRLDNIKSVNDRENNENSCTINSI